MSRIDYDLSKIKAIAFDIDGVLSPATVPLGANGLPNRMVNLKDGYAIQQALKAGIKIVIISGARESGIEKRYLGLGVKDVCMGVADKAGCLTQWMAANGVAAEEIAYCGDDVPDCDAMRLAGLRVSPADGCVDILQIANYISPVVGGYGVARDLIEQILRAQSRWATSAEGFGWDNK